MLYIPQGLSARSGSVLPLSISIQNKSIKRCQTKKTRD